MKRSVNPSVVVLGSANTDLVLECPRLPRPGETLLGGVFRQVPGGKGANQAVAAARAGARVSLIGALGDDDYGRHLRRGLKKDGVDLSHLRTLRGENSGIALILIGGEDRQNLIGVAQSANDKVSVAQVRSAASVIRGAGCVVAQLEVPLAAVQAAAVLSRKFGVPFLLNPAPAPDGALPSTLLKRVDALVPNEHEARLLTGRSSPEAAARDLLAQGCRWVVITLGRHGAFLAGPLGVMRLRAPRVRPIDTVGAGDCFCGWLAAGVAEGLSWEDNARRAIRAASISVTRAGAQDAMPKRNEVEV
ncbi:MAG: ribokinase [Candidatus Methylacidiphilales bacterium]|nr:ribokinase [Candidatus Methylacidiphilales bacterium]